MNLKKGLEGLTEPTLDKEHDDKFGDLHEFVIRAFTWKTKPEEQEMLETIEKTVEDFLEEYITPAETIIAYFSSNTGMGESEAERMFLQLQSAIVAIEAEVTKRYLKAQFGYYIYDNNYYKAYLEPHSAPQEERKAHAIQNTREDRLFYFIQYAAWRIINDKVQSLKASQRYIQQQLYRKAY
jgi:anion-transporting  ArsA/GET3 family ATPase